jgi:hypothetical protein
MLKIEDCIWPKSVGKSNLPFATHHTKSSNDEDDILPAETGDIDDDAATIDDDYELDDIHAEFLASMQDEAEVDEMVDDTTVISYVEPNISDCIIT